MISKADLDTLIALAREVQANADDVYEHGDEYGTEWYGPIALLQYNASALANLIIHLHEREG